MIEPGRAAPLRLIGSPYRVEEVAGRVLVFPHGWPRAQHVAEGNPYYFNTRAQVEEIVGAANAHRELAATLRLLTAAAQAFVERPHPTTWRSLDDARRTARGVLQRLG